MDPKNKKPASSTNHNLDMNKTLSDLDPFARNNHSASEIQEEEKKISEENPASEPATPGNLPPEREVHPLPERPVNPQPEIPAETGRNAPEIVRLPGTGSPEWQAPVSPELPPEKSELPKADDIQHGKTVFPSFHDQHED